MLGRYSPATRLCLDRWQNGDYLEQISRRTIVGLIIQPRLASEMPCQVGLG